MGAEKISMSKGGKVRLSCRCHNALNNLNFRKYFTQDNYPEMYNLGEEFGLAENDEDRKDAVEKFIVATRDPMRLRRIQNIGTKGIDNIVDWLGAERIERINRS